jgi:hypothetical protein
MLHSNRSRSPYEDGTKPMTVQLTTLARELDKTHPGAAASLREG